MATWTQSTSDGLTNKRWAKYMMAQMLQETWFLRLASKEDNSAVLIVDDLQKHAGDQVTYGVSQLMSGPGVLDLNTLTGQEEAVQTYSDSLFIHELAHATLLVGAISNQRVLYDRRKIGRNRLADWYAARVDHAAANQLAGISAQTDTRYTGLQAAVAPSSGRQVFPTAVSPITDAASLGSGNIMDITMLDRAKLKAKSLTTGIRPVKVGGKTFFVTILHPTQVTDLRTNTSTGQWLDIQKAAMTGGDIGDNPIFWSALGMYNQVLIHENPRIPNAQSNAGALVANTKRGLFLGAQACTLAFGRSEGETQKFRWLEEMRDFGRQLGVGVSGVWGMKKIVYNSVDFGVIVLDTYGLDVDTLNSAQTNAQ